MATPTLQGVLAYVPAERIDEMNELLWVVPGVPASEKNLKNMLRELVEYCEANAYGQGLGHEKNTYSVQFHLAFRETK